MVRLREITLATLVCVVLAACGSVGRYDPTPAHTVDLSGNWALNRTASDDPKPVLDKLRPKPVTRRFDAPDEDDSGPPSGAGPDQGGQRGSGRGGRRGAGQGQGPQQLYAYRNNNDAYTHSMVLKMLSADLARADNLTIRQTAEQLSIDYGSSVRTFTPGSVSVVSAAWGVADQSSGWKGKEFIVAVKPQSGVSTLETFSLSSDGKHLVEELRMGGGEFPQVKLKRVYDPSEHPVQRGVPTND